MNINRAIWGLRLGLFYHQLRPLNRPYGILDKWKLKITNKFYRDLYTFFKTLDRPRVFIEELNLGIYCYEDGLDFFHLHMEDPIDFWEPIQLVSWNDAQNLLLDKSVVLLISSDRSCRKVGEIAQLHKKTRKQSKSSN